MDDFTLVPMKELKQQGFFCSQILMTLGMELQGKANRDLIRAMSGMAGGLGLSGETCGALTGGATLPDGEYGEVVFTTLTRHGMPLIRYRTRDISRFIPGRCPCRTSLKTLENVTCRVKGRIPVVSGHLTMADLDEALFAIDSVVNFTATLLRKNQRDRLYLEVQLTDQHGVSQAALTESMHQGMLRSIDLEISFVERVPLDMAKRAIEDRRSANGQGIP